MTKRRVMNEPTIYLDKMAEAISRLDASEGYLAKHNKSGEQELPRARSLLRTRTDALDAVEA